MLMLCGTSCTTGSYVPRCPGWSEAAVDEFVVYMRRYGQSPMVQAVLRDSQVCSALKELQ